MTTDRITQLEAELARQARAKAEAQTAREYAAKQMRKARRERDRLAAVVARVEALAYSPKTDKFRDEACRGEVELPYANNRYLHLLDDLRAALGGDT